MSKFSKGHWEICPLYIEQGKHIRLFVIRDEDIIAQVGDTDLGNPEIEANARLIAAAPDMYNLLIAAVNHLPYQGNISLIDKIGDLLASINEVDTE